MSDGGEEIEGGDECGLVCMLNVFEQLRLEDDQSDATVGREQDECAYHNPFVAGNACCNETACNNREVNKIKCKWPQPI